MRMIPSTGRRFIVCLGAALVLGASPLGCHRSLYDADKATRAYPESLHTTTVVDIQVFREGESIELRNATATTYRDFDLWINQRWVRRVEELRAGGTLRLSLWDFWDERGETINAGGLFRTDVPTPVRLVEIQMAEDAPMVCLVAIRAEPAE